MLIGGGKLMRKARILLVENENDIMQINKSYLEQQDYEILCAASLRAARAILWERPPDLVLLDVMLPDGSGYELCREIRRISSAPVIYVTCLGGDADIVTGLKEGGDDYIVKPYSLTVLHARIMAQLRRLGTVTGEISLPPLYINLAAGTVQLDGNAISLTRKEFQLLVYLVENRGRELSQHQIYEAVWGDSSETMGNTLRVHISRLRHKLSLDEGSAFELAPTAGQGYIFLRTVCRS